MPFLEFAHSLLRTPSEWSVGERELFAAVVSRANRCQFCVGTHGEIAAKELGRDVLAGLDERRLGPRAVAAAAFVEALTRDPNGVTARVRASLRPRPAAGARALRRLGYRLPAFLLR